MADGTHMTEAAYQEIADDMARIQRSIEIAQSALRLVREAEQLLKLADAYDVDGDTAADLTAAASRIATAAQSIWCKAPSRASYAGGSHVSV